MLKEILSISGRSGLFKMLSQAKNSFIVESLQDHKRMPVYASDRVISLAEVAIYTELEEVPLGEVLDMLYKIQEGKEVNLKELGTDKKALFTFFETVLPSFDKERVYPTDIKKLINWYNLLVKNGFESFSMKKEGEEEENKEE